MSITQNCQSVRGLLMLYLDSELDATVTHSVNQHLLLCPECRQRFEAEQLLESAIASGMQTGEDMPEDVWQRLTAKLAAAVDAPLEQAPTDSAQPAAQRSTMAPTAQQRPRRGSRSKSSARPWRLSWPMAAWVAAAAMLVAAVTLWMHDPGVPGELRSGGLMNQLATLHRGAAVSSSLDPALAAQGLLAEMSLPAAMLPVAALADSISGHPLSLVGAEQVRVLDVPALNLRYECCGVPVSVYLIPRGDLLDLPAELLPATPAALAAGDVQGTVDGLLTRLMLSGDVFVGVVSEHSVVLGDAWSS